MHTDLLNPNGCEGALQFLWVEVTNRCNLQCAHCYAESGPHTGRKDLLSSAQYQELIRDAYTAGCRQIQFIGGEPTLNPDLPAFINLSSDLGYTFIEIFTNLTRLSDSFVSCLKKYHVHVATSIYAACSEIHDGITDRHGSFSRTVKSILKLLEAEVPVRVGIIEMPQNAMQVQTTARFLSGLGVKQIGMDRVRAFGRAGVAQKPEIGELCGQCADNVLCVGSDGRVSPCIMSKYWSIGSLFAAGFTELLTSARLCSIRREIYRATIQCRQDDQRRKMRTICDPKTCGPYSTCVPTTGPGPCAPNGCTPCFPKG